jgi:hypothetical protein
MAKRVPGVKVVGGAHDNVAACTHPVNQGDEVTIGKSINVKALFTPRSVQVRFYNFQSKALVVVIGRV